MQLNMAGCQKKAHAYMPIKAGLKAYVPRAARTSLTQ